MTLIKACIVDDETLAIAAIRVDLTRHCSQVEVVSEFKSPAQALEYLRTANIDLLFLDIEMPEMTGLELLDKLGNFNFDVVFTTAYSEYALQAFKLNAIDYLLKPVDTQELVNTVNRVIEKKKLAANIPKPFKIALADANSLEFVAMDNIMYCIADKNYTTFYLQNGSKKLVSKNIGEYEKILDNSKFIRIHQSSIVNVNYVSKLIKGENGAAVMEDGCELSVSRAKRKDFLAELQKIATQ